MIIVFLFYIPDKKNKWKFPPLYLIITQNLNIPYKHALQFHQFHWF